MAKKKAAAPAKKAAPKKNSKALAPVEPNEIHAPAIRLSVAAEAKIANMADGIQEMITELMEMARKSMPAVKEPVPVLFWAHFSGGNLQSEKRELATPDWTADGFMRWLDLKAGELQTANGNTKFVVTNCGVISSNK